jgi:translation initiation factor IF-2
MQAADVPIIVAINKIDKPGAALFMYASNHHQMPTVWLFLCMQAADVPIIVAINKNVTSNFQHK